MYRSSRFLPLLLLAVAMIAFACKGKTTTSTTEGTPRATENAGAETTNDNTGACATLEPADVATAAGGGKFTEEPDPNDPTYCVWATEGEPAIQVVLSLSGPAYAEGNRTSFDGHAKKQGAETVTGLGEKAVWVPSDSTLYVLKSDRLILVLALGSTYQNVELLKEVAAKAITNV